MRVCPRHHSLIGKGAIDGEELFTIEGSKNWRSTPGQRGGARTRFSSANCAGRSESTVTLKICDILPKAMKTDARGTARYCS